MDEMLTLRDLAHQKGKKLIYGTSAWFETDTSIPDRLETMLSNDTLRAAFVQDVSNFVKANDLDGADFDLEYPYSTAEINGWADLMTDMRAALGMDRLLIACVSSWTVLVSVNTINSKLDWIQTMSYHYRDLTEANADITRYLNNGVHASKIVLGVAFGGTSRSGGGERLYNDLVNLINPYSPSVDTVTDPDTGYVYELGGNRNTQQAKLWAAASRANGTMIWHLAGDTTDATTSLAVALTQARTNRVAVVDGYEQADGVDLDGMPDAFEVAKGFNRSSASDATLDSDGDGMSNLKEYLCGTDPLNLSDVLKVTNPTPAASGVTLRFPTVAGKTYIVEWTLSLTQAWQALATVSGTGGEVAATDTGATADQQRFYRIRLDPWDFSRLSTVPALRRCSRSSSWPLDPPPPRRKSPPARPGQP